jgi:hypothetical protein
MKLIILALGLSLSTLSLAQNITPFSGDYVLKMAISACNQNARVEIQNKNITITNPDLRDNRGWATTKLSVGETSRTMVNGAKQIERVSIVKTQLVVESIILKSGKEVAYEKDLYSFSDANGKKSLSISLSVVTRGNVSGYGTTCIYEKN